MIFQDDADVVIKREKRTIPDMNNDDSDSSIEIVHEDLRSKPNAMAQGGRNLNSVKPSISSVKSNVTTKKDHPKPNR